MRRPRPLILVLFIAGCLHALAWYAARHPLSAASDDVASVEHFKYGSVGIEDNEGLPYWIWQVLPRMFADKLPGPGGYSSLGILWEKGRELPIGFSKKRVIVDRVAINCAFCHTTSVRSAPGREPKLFPGGPSNLTNPQAYVRFLQECANDPRFNATNLLREIGRITTLSWRDSLLYRAVFVPGTRKALMRQRDEYAWMASRPLWGPGRIDPFNPVKFRVLDQPLDDTIGNSDMMPVWNMQARQGMALHWDGLSTSLREVALSSAIGDGASRKSIDLASLRGVEQWMLATPAPKYPFQMDEALARAGQDIYLATCASCHAFGQPRTGTVIPLEEVGTDRHRLDMWTAAAAQAYNDFASGYEWKFKGFRKANGYVAVPHDGLWIRAPYLHNGSVPSLTDLLEAPADRPKVFYRGYDVYDPQRVGFVSSGTDAERAGFKYDTSLPGNSNQGHAWGTTLSADEKRALIEYLKTL
jgi:cytochrome c5